MSEQLVATLCPLGLKWVVHGLQFFGIVMSRVDLVLKGSAFFGVGGFWLLVSEDWYDFRPCQIVVATIRAITTMIVLFQWNRLCFLDFFFVVFFI